MHVLHFCMNYMPEKEWTTIQAFKVLNGIVFSKISYSIDQIFSNIKLIFEEIFLEFFTSNSKIYGISLKHLLYIQH